MQITTTRSQVNDEQTANEVMGDFDHYEGDLHQNHGAIFEYGHWCMFCNDCEAGWNVVDDAAGGFAFEPIKRGDGYCERQSPEYADRDWDDRG